jgi:ribosomal protein S18 acetylase RimI-like enzyme
MANGLWPMACGIWLVAYGDIAVCYMPSAIRYMPHAICCSSVVYLVWIAPALWIGELLAQTPEIGPSGLEIRPLSFLQTYLYMGGLLEALVGADVDFAAWFEERPALRLLARVGPLPLFYHLANSSYGAFMHDELVGWLCLHGCHQAMHIEVMAVRPEHRRRGIGRALTRYAEYVATVLGRRWLSLRVTVSSQEAVRLYESEGYQRAHWHILRCEGGSTIPAQGGVTLRALVGPAARWAFYRFSEADLTAGDAWGAEILTRHLATEPRRRLGRHWLAWVGDEPVAYLNMQGPRTSPRLYLAAPPAWWGTPQEAAMLKAVRDRLGGVPSAIELRLASSGHHIASARVLAEYGFEERPTRKMQMLKLLA